MTAFPRKLRWEAADVEYHYLAGWRGVFPCVGG